ncbi:uncharacterized protein LOC130988421 isoform X3 [Salvia miltiorrhiza]|uniref:uncharacterized protein LOC130988421 isoform X3 n=2 Tax=Salvia miltiorrhiza TaxID=226208 RepID=UPI0025AD472E|nr:uncharacterized protein LOC130988421 isoform X3 [Salvia miltiorrhiza]
MHSSISDALMAAVVKMETTDAASPYDLEYRASEDDAWYSVCAVLDAAAETLTVKYMCSPEVYEVVFSAGNFQTEAQVEELVARFRPVSQQLQDEECLRLSIGTTVCAAHGTGDNDLRFYDAVVEAVDRRTHSFVGGEEECLCTFVLVWQHGRGRGTLTSVNIASICFLEPATQIDPRISAFAKMARKNTTSFKSMSAPASVDLASNGPSKGKKNSRISITNDLELPQNRPVESEITAKLKTQTKQMEDSAKISNYDQCTNQDEDMGPKPCNTNDSATSDGLFFLLIYNLEKDLSPSSIKSFIYEKTTILPEAYVFPSHVSQPFARGAIMVDSQMKVQTIYEYLDNPNHFVVSSSGRPWVIFQKALAGTSEASIWNLLPVSREEIKHKRTDRELEVVVSGTKSYERAKQLRDLVMDFLCHESEVSKRLVLQEKKILGS